jgi:hypothetical protein
LYFIKIGSAKNANQAVAIQFGLVGALVAHFAAKRAEKQNQAKLNEVAGLPPEQLLAMDKVNRAIDIAQITDPSLEPSSFWSGHRFGSWRFRDERGKKKVFAFEDGDNFQIAARRLPEIFGDRLRVNARWDDSRNKAVKVATTR